MRTRRGETRREQARRVALEVMSENGHSPNWEGWRVRIIRGEEYLSLTCRECGASALVFPPLLELSGTALEFGCH